MITVRRAEMEDIPKIMQFIEEHWKKGHIMGNDRTMFEFQHVRGNEVFYILAEDDADKTLYGTMGYIPMSYGEDAVASTMMICSLNNPEKRMLGNEMAGFFQREMGFRNEVSVGIRKRYAKAIQVLHEERIGKLEHYYMLNEKQEFKVATILHYEKMPIRKMGGSFVLLDTIESFKEHMNLQALKETFPYRSLAYIQHRYYDHPYYQYQVWGIQRNDCVRSAFVARVQEACGEKLLRIVDFLGEDDELSYAGDAFRQLIEKEDYEYIDFYQYGIASQIMKDAGFVFKPDDDSNVIPNYFCPFERKNIEIYFAAWDKTGIHAYCGFGDQDRPNHKIK